VHPALRLVRVENLAVSFVGTVVGGLVARGTGVLAPDSFWAAVLLAGISTALITAGGNVLNDVLDVEGDRTNHPDRPLVTGEISVETARGLVVALFLGGFIVVLPVIALYPLVGLILGLAVVALLGYEFLLKARGFVGNMVVAFLTGMVFLYGGAAGGNAAILLPFAGMAFLATLSREVIKDMEDVRGDVGRTTLPMAYGLPYAARLARFAVLGAVLLSVVPLAWFVAATSLAGMIYIGSVAVADLIFGVSVRYLPERLHYEQTMSKVAMTVALVAFLAVAFR
jgi:geranylgeranylglycerol-phosphate geranylgeranyltransferase